MENEKHVMWSLTKMHSMKFFSLELPREKLKNILEISRKTQGILFLKNVVTLIHIWQITSLARLSLTKYLLQF